MYTTDTVPSTSRRAARDLHPGDVVQQFDWSLHVRSVTLDTVDVLVAVTEFEFPLHYTADALVQLAA
jgi:hypothetical protein